MIPIRYASCLESPISREYPFMWPTFVWLTRVPCYCFLWFVLIFLIQTQMWCHIEPSISHQEDSVVCEGEVTDSYRCRLTACNPYPALLRKEHTGIIINKNNHTDREIVCKYKDDPMENLIMFQCHQNSMVSLEKVHHSVSWAHTKPEIIGSSLII